MLLLTIYTGCRAEELLFILYKRIFLDKNYFIAGVKTKAGINREIPIHPDIKPYLKNIITPKMNFYL